MTLTSDSDWSLTLISICGICNIYLYYAKSELGIAVKLIRLCKATLSNTKSCVRIGKDFPKPLDTKRGFTQGVPIV